MAEFEREVLVDWAEGDCVFRMSVPINSGPPSPRSRITGDVILIVDRYRADGRRMPPHVRVILPIRLLDATRLAVVPFAREDVVHEVVGAWSRSPFHGRLPDDLVLALADVLSLFFRDVAGEMDSAPDVTYVSAVARVRLFNADGGQEVAEEEGDEEEVAEQGEHEGDEEEFAAEEEEEVGNGVDMEEEGDEEPSTTAGEGEEEGQEAEGEEETRCAICLGSMASGAAAEGRRERWWLPCCHCFHRGCLQRWLQQKEECPLCRAPAAASGGGGGQHHHS